MVLRIDAIFISIKKIKERMWKKMIEEKEVKVIQNGIIGKHLLEKGYSIVDLKPHKYNKKFSVFVFLVEKDFWYDLARIEHDLKEKRKQKLRLKLQELD